VGDWLFTLAEGYSSISTRCGTMRAQPFACTWMIEGEDRPDNLVLDANRNHWNTARGPRLERVVFRNNLSPEQALDLCCTTEGEMDIVTEVSPADAQKVIDSEHAELITCDANCVLVGIFNRYPSDVPLDDLRMRKALNQVVDFQKIIDRGLNGYANPLPALTPAWSGRYPHGIAPYAHDPEQAKDLMIRPLAARP
jgi:ABC-type transport system substrate-binding protein